MAVGFWNKFKELFKQAAKWIVKNKDKIENWIRQGVENVAPKVSQGLRQIHNEKADYLADLLDKARTNEYRRHALHLPRASNRT